MLTGYLGCFRKTLIGVIAISHETKEFRLFLVVLIHKVEDRFNEGNER